MTPRDLFSRWEDQQAAYVAHRENRFQVMLDVLGLHRPDDPTVLDLACGPGSITDRVLSRFPRARAVAVDHDPVLAELARSVLESYEGRARVVEADLAHAGWSSALPAWSFDAVLTSTALHWLSPGQLLAVYTELARLLPPGSVLLNADHLRFGDGQPALRRMSAEHDTAVRKAAFAGGAATWEQWWALAAEHPRLAPLTLERERRFADRPPQPPAPLEFHLAALRTAGFTEVGTVWQYLDDHVVFARR
ncbi:class I SAM-dependent methyltransferase [Sphaerisporangium sp. TRM90804]|uniref:class I SAM-dependent methyltransferase n=1 Tax=Sphaerisporangium sp. TRM90804 TaxID=3031113 RepID=UPI00244C20FF|nr:class I SAM-dependent methyltransferase [Sphaerisporangium sp. TRM90804]MDH2426064.1 class I SAM-dependent methyltransferase [Sphaerisporangium sp. TRM90804]